MGFILNSNTQIVCDDSRKAVLNAVSILKRDMEKKFTKSDKIKNNIVLKTNSELDSEAFVIEAGDDMTVYASDELGFVYGLLYISERFLGIKPFWFWMEQKIEKVYECEVAFGEYKSAVPVVKYRGWFVNDEVLIMRWNIGGDEVEPWRMVFEALLRCGGNTVIPGTDKNSKIYRSVAADMGLWITHHHAEPLGAEMFTRVYPGEEPNYAEHSERFKKLWEDAVKEQKDLKVIWALGFRGQGDCPFWCHDSSGKYNTEEKRGQLISDLIELQKNIVKKYVDNPVFCTNLYGEIMELYEDGYINFSDDIIKVSADNGYGKMVTRRRDNHTVRISSMPKNKVDSGGIYYHVSFYDLQAANHITMLPNSVDFVNSELSEVMEKNMNDMWIINCSNVKPHTYYLDAIRKKWYGEEISDETHSVDFVNNYYSKNVGIAQAYRKYHEAMIPYGSEEDEHAGEQIYNENIRLIIHSVFNNRDEGTPGLRWLVGQESLESQAEKFTAMCANNFENIRNFYNECMAISNSISGDAKYLFDTNLFLQVKIHYYCTLGVMSFGDGYKEFAAKNMKKAFIKFGNSAEYFDTANNVMRDSEQGVWKGFYFNECFADIKHTAYMVKKLMGLVRERGDNARHDKWYRDIMYKLEDRNILTLLVNDNHMTDWELYEEFKKNGEFLK